jgi:integrase
MPHEHLTPRLVTALAPGAGRPRETWFDTSRDAPKGFALRVTAAGARSYYLVLRIAGRQRWLRIGDARRVTLDAARKAAQARAGDVAMGIDPTAEARAAKAAARQARSGAASQGDEWTVNVLLSTYTDARRSGLAANTLAAYQRAAKDLARGPLGEQLARDVVRADVRAALARIARRSSQAARLAHALLCAAYRWALDEEVLTTGPDGKRVARPRVDRDPTRRVLDDLPTIRAARARRRERVLSDAELPGWWRALDSLPQASATFARLLLLCGTRRAETWASRWSDYELEGDAPAWTIRAETRKGRVAGTPGARRSIVVPLSPLAVELLRELREADLRTASPFRGRIWLSVLGARIHQATGLDVTLHDLRRSCSTGLQRMGAPPHVLSIVLGHARETGSASTDAAYTHDRRQVEHRLWLERWSAHVERLIGREPGKVVSFPA